MNEDLEANSQAEASDLSAELTNVVRESALDREIEDQLQETGSANGAVKMNVLNKGDFEKISRSQIPFEKSDSFAEINIAG